MRTPIAHSRIAFYLVAAGTVAGLAQVVLFRELLVVATGTELVIGLVLAAWLVCAAFGSLWADRGATNPRAAVERAWKLSLAAAVSLGIGVLVVRAARPILSTLPNAVASLFPAHSKLNYLFARLVAVQPGEALPVAHVLALGIAATALPAFCCGAQFVTATRLMGGPRRSSVAYALDAIGHLLGGVALAFAATVWLDGLSVAAIVSILAWAAGAAILPRSQWRRVLAAAAAATVLAGAWLAIAPVSRSWRSPLARVLDERAGLFGLFTVAEQRGGGVYFFINGTPAGASPPTPRAEVLVNFALAQLSNPDHILLIGGGGSGAVTECLKHNPTRVDYVDFDPVFLAMITKWCAEPDRKSLSDPRVHKAAVDPRLFLRRSPATYDAVIVDLPPPTSALMNRFYTTEWFRLCAAKLGRGGVVAFALPYSQVYRSRAMAVLDRSIVSSAATGLSAAPASLALLAGDELVVAIKRNGATVQAPEKLTQALAARGIDAPYLEAFCWDWADAYNVQQARAMLSGKAEPNSDRRPIGYLLGTTYWLAQMTPTLGKAVERLVSTWDAQSALAWLLAAAAPGLGATLLALLGLRRPAAGAAMAAAGFGSMAGELGVLFALQNACGYVYAWVGLVTGAFMLGLALGSMAVYGSGTRFARPALAVIFCATAIAGIYSLLAGYAAPAIFPLLSFFCGVFGGVAFAISVRAAALSRRGVGAIYAADLAGGVFGAALVPAFLVPLLGSIPSATVPLLAAVPALVLLVSAMER